MKRTVPLVTILGMFIASVALLWFCSESSVDFRTGFFEVLSAEFPAYWVFKRRKKSQALREDSRWVILLRRYYWLRFVGPVALMLLLELIVLGLDKEARTQITNAVLTSILVALNSGVIIGFALSARLEESVSN